MGIEDWKDVTSRKHRRSKDDEVLKISKSVFVTNFPESISARDLWKSCSVYGTVVDVFIPSKKSKVGKRFAFVRFIKVLMRILLMETSMGLKAPVISSSPALVLDDSCLIDRDLSNHVLGKVKEFSSIPNLHTILKDEGFSLLEFVNVVAQFWIVMEDIIRVGQVMGYSIGRLRERFRNIIENTGRAESLGKLWWYHMYMRKASILQEALTHTYGNVIAIYGTWLPTIPKICLCYLCSSTNFMQRKLWDYISNIVGRWNGESIIMGDFNEVRSSENGWDPGFNPL
ncbi:RNA-directed DNA polymerase, eukaryota [Tanacetum coccineum]